MSGVASRLNVEIRIIARRALRLHGIILIVGSQLLYLIVDILANEVALFDPSRLSGSGTNFDEVTIVVEDFDAVAILDDSGLLIDGSDVIAQVGLDSGDVGDFEDASATVFAAREKECIGKAEHERCGSK